MNRVLDTFRVVLERYLLVWLVLLCGLAYVWADWFGRGTLDPFTASKSSLPYLIMAAMFAIGSLLPLDEIRQVARRWPTVLAGTGVQYLAMPLLGWSMGKLFGLEGAWLVGIVVVGCVPGAMASNVLTLMARGNTSYSVSLTTSATLLSPLAVPLVMWLALGREVPNFPAAKVCWELLWMVVFPVVAGHLLARGWAGWRSAAGLVGPIAANLTILWIIAVVVAVNRGQVALLDARLLAALAAVNILGYLAGYAGGYVIRLDDPMRRALTIEVGMQNAGLGTTLALSLFPDLPAAALPAALYTFGCMFTGIVLARAWAQFTPRPSGDNRPGPTTGS